MARKRTERDVEMRKCRDAEMKKYGNAETQSPQSKCTQRTERMHFEQVELKQH